MRTVTSSFLIAFAALSLGACGGADSGPLSVADSPSTGTPAPSPAPGTTTPPAPAPAPAPEPRSEEHTSELQSRENLVCRLLLEKKKLHYSDLLALNGVQ